MGSEFELKYRATPETLDAIPEVLQGEIRHFEMRTTYYDTRDRALSARHWTLRRRMENNTSVCTLKTPLPDGSRGEFELECDGIEKAILELCKLSGSAELALLAAKGLTEICGAAFHRRAITVTLEDAVAEVALDQGTLLGSGKALPFCELEVEWKAGDRATVVAFAEDLAAKFRLEPEHQSKFRRAADLAGGI